MEYQSEPLDLSCRKKWLENEDEPHETVCSRKKSKSSAIDGNASIQNSDAVGAVLFQPIYLKFYNIEEHLCQKLLQHRFDSIKYIYNPIDYAKEPHLNFLKAYCDSPRDLLFIGMNPGPFGMCQTGVPFGEVSYVKNWLNISGHVGRPLLEHPKKKVTGFSCKRKEVSGFRFWSLLEDICGSPELFFQNCFIHNYCPLAFLSDSGKNITPPELKLVDRKYLIAVCDQALVDIIHLLQAKVIVAIGRFAYQRLKIALSNFNGIRVEKIMHPSPINPTANKGWKNIVNDKLISSGLILYLTNKNNSEN